MSQLIQWCCCSCCCRCCCTDYCFIPRLYTNSNRLHIYLHYILIYVVERTVFFGVWRYQVRHGKRLIILLAHFVKSVIAYLFFQQLSLFLALPLGVLTPLLSISCSSSVFLSVCFHRVHCFAATFVGFFFVLQFHCLFSILILTP